MIHAACNGYGYAPIRLPAPLPQTSNKKAPYSGPPIICSQCHGVGFFLDCWKQATSCNHCLSPHVTDRATYERVATMLGGREPRLNDFLNRELWPDKITYVADLIRNGVPEHVENRHG